MLLVAIGICEILPVVNFTSVGLVSTVGQPYGGLPRRNIWSVGVW